jgi:hypothetical protein
MEMNITQTGSVPQQGKNSRLVLSAVAIVIVALLLAFVVTSIAGIWRLPVSDGAIVRGIDADASRYAALGQHYVSRGAEADAARWAALGRSYLSASGPAALPYTDVSHFYAERMRAQAKENAELALNPELSFARRGYGAQDPLGRSYLTASGPAASPYTDVSHFYVERMRAQARENAGLALNPELSFARRGYRAQDPLAANPELAAARRGYRSAALLSAGTELETADRPAVQGRATCSFAGNDVVVPEALLFYHFERYC